MNTPAARQESRENELHPRCVNGAAIFIELHCLLFVLLSHRAEDEEEQETAAPLDQLLVITVFTLTEMKPEDGFLTDPALTSPRRLTLLRRIRGFLSVTFFQTKATELCPSDAQRPIRPQDAEQT
ncbi:hypothetical protein FQA47_024531 [Oryzias melastigma]|uniref:Uncharacterized protein n=1 Tax=Oryzias melastigma TaxID=30732 RepID=A0A834FK02_ORYME|nr:hypothetical protein FQA47_024531 [Oryzias melastigma]